MRMTDREYQEYVMRLSPPSPVRRDAFRAFWTGGAICVLGQLIRNGWTDAGLTEEAAGTMTAVTMVFLGALLTGLGIYSKLAHYAGAGTVVPITGFANSIAAPAMEFRTESLVLGTCAKMFTIAGPVIVYGIGASVVYGIIYYLASCL